jgi:Leucine-rich repeat (LRR) protein
VVPESIGSLTALTSLDVSDNKLTVVPEAFGNLTGLTGLWLNGNQLTVVPSRSVTSPP